MAAGDGRVAPIIQSERVFAPNEPTRAAGCIGAAPGTGTGLADFLVTPRRRLVGAPARYSCRRGKRDCRRHNANIPPHRSSPHTAITKRCALRLSRSIRSAKQVSGRSVAAGAAISTLRRGRPCGRADAGLVAGRLQRICAMSGGSHSHRLLELDLLEQQIHHDLPEAAVFESATPQPCAQCRCSQWPPVTQPCPADRACASGGAS